MAIEDDDFRRLMRRAAEGCEDAARVIVEEYGESIRRAVRRVLNSRLRSKFDSLDFAQLVWCSVFRVRDRLERFDRPEDLVAFLVGTARNKVGLEARRHLQTDKYGVNQEHQWIEDSLQEQAEIPDCQPAAIDVAIAKERLEGMASQQPPDVWKIIQLRLQGKTHKEIARLLQVTRTAVYRFLKKLSLNTSDGRGAGRKGQFMDAETAVQPTAGERAAPRASVNDQVMDLLYRKPEASAWSARQIATALGCGKSAVADSDAFKKLERARDLARLDRAEKARAANHRRGGS
jgi:RNA polymerase sigma factor (sigma-70 family)